MEKEETIEKRQRDSEEGLEGRPNPNPLFHHNQETWSDYLDWEDENPNSDTVQRYIWNQSPELKELNILRLWERNNFVKNWSLNYKSISELYINRVLEIHSEISPSLTTKVNKIEIVFGNFTEEKINYGTTTLERVSESLKCWMNQHLENSLLKKYDQKDKFWIIIIDYILVRKGLRPKNKCGKFGYTFEQIDEIEQLYERWINC